jgi:hypothetical protein
MHSHEHAAENLHVVLRLLEIFFPLFFQLFVLHTAQRGRVDLYAAQLGFQRLIQKLMDLRLVHGVPPLCTRVMAPTADRVGAVVRRARTVPSSPRRSRALV